MSHLNTNRADSSLKIPWLQWKIPDAVPNSLTIPWYFVKMREFFKFPNNCLILLILLITVNPAISFWSAFNFCESVSACKKSVYSICSFFRYSQFWSPTIWLAVSIFDHVNPHVWEQFLICMKLCQHTKSGLIPLVQSWNIVNFKVQRPDWPYPFLTMPNKKT